MSLRKFCTCPRKQHLKCAHPWAFDFALNGVRYRESIRTADRKLARDIEAEVRSNIVRGTYGLAKPKTITLCAFWDIYRVKYAENALRESSMIRTARAWKALEPTLGNFHLSAITGEQMGGFASKRRADGCKPGSINRELATLSGILGKAVEWGYLQVRPAIPFLRVENGRERILTDEEVRKLLDAYKGHQHEPILQLLVITGARESEILNLKWENVNGTITFKNTKNGKDRKLPHTPATEALFGRLPKHSLWVFPAIMDVHKPMSASTFYAAFKRRVRELDLGEDVCVHTLRHTAASRMIRNGADVRTAQEVLGHSSLSMLQRYTHPLEAAKRAALQDCLVGVS